MLKDTFLELVSIYSDDIRLKNELWTEIEKSYSGEKRHYHNLNHLNNLLAQLMEVKGEIQNWESVLFTLYYHDIIYDPLKPDNEEKSADLAEKRLKQISVSIETIERCKKQILATKSHLNSSDKDTNYFTDADLSVLGQPWETYSRYYNNIREEYSIYPDAIYKPGRKRVLAHFIAMDRIFKTDYFYNRLEEQAKNNLMNEISSL